MSAPAFPYQEVLPSGARMRPISLNSRSGLLLWPLELQRVPSPLLTLLTVSLRKAAAHIRSPFRSGAGEMVPCFVGKNSAFRHLRRRRKLSRCHLQSPQMTQSVQRACFHPALAFGVDPPGCAWAACQRGKPHERKTDMDPLLQQVHAATSISRGDLCPQDMSRRSCSTAGVRAEANRGPRARRKPQT